MKDEEQGFAVVQRAPKSDKVIMALVDRTQTTELWWTADNAGLICKFYKRHAADHSAARLKGAFVMEYNLAVEIITEQASRFAFEAEKQEEK